MISHYLKEAPVFAHFPRKHTSSTTPERLSYWAHSRVKEDTGQDKLFIMRFNDGSATGQLKGIKKDSSGNWLVCDLTADGNDVVTSTCVSMATFSLTGVSLDDLLFVELYLKGDEGNTLWKWYLSDVSLLIQDSEVSADGLISGKNIIPDVIVSKFDSHWFSPNLAYAADQTPLSGVVSKIKDTEVRYSIQVGKENYEQGVTFDTGMLKVHSLIDADNEIAKTKIEFPWGQLLKIATPVSDPTFNLLELGECIKAVEGVTPCGVPELALKILSGGEMDQTPAEIITQSGTVRDEASNKRILSRVEKNFGQHKGLNTIKTPVVVKTGKVFVPLALEVAVNLASGAEPTYDLVYTSLRNAQQIYSYSTHGTTQTDMLGFAEEVRQGLLDGVGSSIMERLLSKPLDLGEAFANSLTQPALLSPVFKSSLSKFLDKEKADSGANLFAGTLNSVLVSKTNPLTKILPQELVEDVYTLATAAKGSPLSSVEKEMAVNEYTKLWRTLLKIGVLAKEHTNIPRPISGEACAFVSNKAKTGSTEGLKISTGEDCKNPKAVIDLGVLTAYLKGIVQLEVDVDAKLGRAEYEFVEVDKTTHSLVVSGTKDTHQASFEVTSPTQDEPVTVWDFVHENGKWDTSFSSGTTMAVGTETISVKGLVASNGDFESHNGYVDGVSVGIFASAVINSYASRQTSSVDVKGEGKDRLVGAAAVSVNALSPSRPSVGASVGVSKGESNFRFTWDPESRRVVSRVALIDDDGHFNLLAEGSIGQSFQVKSAKYSIEIDWDNIFRIGSFTPSLTGMIYNTPGDKDCRTPLVGIKVGGVPLNPTLHYSGPNCELPGVVQETFTSMPDDRGHTLFLQFGFSL